MSSYHLSDQTIPDYIRALEQWQPTYIDSYPSAIGEIARYINEHAVAHRIAPDFILTSSETLTETQREDIRRAFNNTRIIDHFGCSEMAVSAYTRADNRYLIEPLYALVDFAPLDNSSSTSLLCTGLLNMAMPLLRYQIGDTVEDGRAGLGPAYADRTFAAVAGREDDLIITPDGRRIGRLDPAFKGLDGISRAQIIQHSPEELQVLVVPATGADRAAVAHKLESNLQARTDPRMHIRIDFVDDIPLTKSGKFKSVISKIGRNG
jgi:phenylacetate-CoA ligase